MGIVLRPRVGNRTVAAGVAAGFVGTSMLVLSLVNSQSAQAEPSVTLCHATNAASNPYVSITVDVAGGWDGHDKHTGPVFDDSMKSGDNWGDIIPPTTYNGVEFSLNWDAAGQAIWNNGCTPPSTQPSTTVTATTTTTATATTTATVTDTNTATDTVTATDSIGSTQTVTKTNGHTKTTTETLGVDPTSVHSTPADPSSSSEGVLAETGPGPIHAEVGWAIMLLAAGVILVIVGSQRQRGRHRPGHR